MAVEGRGGGGARGGGWVGVGEDGAMDDAKYMPCLEGGGCYLQADRALKTFSAALRAAEVLFLS